MATLSSPTLERLIKEIRIFLNQEKESNSFWSDAELTLYINDAVRSYFLEVNERAEGFFDTTADLDLVANVETVALPDNCFEVKAVYKKLTDGYQILPYKNNLLDSYVTNGGGSGDNYLPYYYFRQNNLVLRPQPGASETAGLKIEYTGFPETLIWGGDSLTNQVSPVFKELIVMYAVYKAKIKEDLVNGSNTSQKASAHLSDLYENFKQTVGFRSKFPQFIKPFNP